MALAKASRFAVLKLEDDDMIDSLKEKTKQQKNQNIPTSGKDKGNAKSCENKSKSKKKKKPTEVAELQNLAFGNPNPKSKSKSSNQAKHIPPNSKQWEEWKQKDNEFVSDTYEQDLQEALLLSKIDYEEKKEIYEATQKETEQSKSEVNKKKKKKNNQKKNMMSLDDFLYYDSNEEVVVPQVNPSVEDIKSNNTDFFDELEKDVGEIINKEQKNCQVKAIDPVVESARLLQYQEDIRKKDEEIGILNTTIVQLKEELKGVKSRNKKLYNILDSGEMREKADILFEIDQLTCVKDELTEQINEYHTALEQERSKVHSLTAELKKYQNSKKQRTESK